MLYLGQRQRGSPTLRQSCLAMFFLLQTHVTISTLLSEYSILLDTTIERYLRDRVFTRQEKWQNRNCHVLEKKRLYQSRTKKTRVFNLALIFRVKVKITSINPLFLFRGPSEQNRMRTLFLWLNQPPWLIHTVVEYLGYCGCQKSNTLHKIHRRPWPLSNDLISIGYALVLPS